MNERILYLKTFAKQIRLETLKQLNHLGFGHYGGTMSLVELLAVLYGEIMKYDPKNPEDEQRDYFVLSKGHAGPVLYSTLALTGFFDKTLLQTLNKNGTSLPSHPDRLLTPGVDATTGSLGQGISIASGIALGLKLDNKPNRVFVVVGDGELNEGQCWEAIQFIAHHQLTNLVLFIDFNKKQLDGELNDIIKPFDLVDKLNAFGLEAKMVKGDSVEAIRQILITEHYEKPLAVVLDTIKGQGVDYLTTLSNNHHLRLDDDSRQKIEAAIKQMEENHE